MSDVIKLCAVGDVFLSRRLPEKPYPGFRELKQLIEKHDVRFANLETTVHRQEGTPGAVSGGTWSMCPPEALDDFTRYNFNLYNAANNHALDYSQDGLLATIRNLEQRGCRYAGIGRNLSDASAPIYLDCVGGRVALIGVTSSFAPFWAAGNQKHDMPGRPGVNPLRYQTRYHIRASEMEALKQIAAETGINASHELSVREGFETASPGLYTFAGKQFVEDEKSFPEEIPDTADMERTLAAIADAGRNADIVLVSVHSHQLGSGRKDCPADFLRQFCHACIDAGAAAVLGHGPHILRGIEVYQGGVIFYSLGNFLFENDTVAKMPSDLFRKYGLSENATVSEAMNVRSRGGTIGLAAEPKVWHSVVASLRFTDGRVESVSLYPITLHGELPVYRRGLPALSGDEAVLKELQLLSADFRTDIRIRGGVGTVVL